MNSTETESGVTATLKTVAAAAGVSIRTAGRALSGSGPVKAEVASRVLQAARELNYVPNAAARNLRRRSSRIVGVITGSGIRSEVIQRRLWLLENALREADRHTLLGALPGTPEELCSLLREWAGLVDRVVFLGWHESWNPEMLHQLPQRVLFIDSNLRNDSFDRFLIDRASGVEAAVGEFLRNGRRRIVHAFEPHAAGRQLGFRRAFREALGGVAALELECGGLEFADGSAAGPRLLELRPDAVFFDTDRMALGFYRFARTNGIRIPEEIAVAGFDNDTPGRFAIPTLTTVEQPDRELVRRAVEWVASDPAPPRTEIFPTQLIPRESSGFPNESPQIQSTRSSVK